MYLDSGANASNSSSLKSASLALKLLIRFITSKFSGSSRDRLISSFRESFTSSHLARVGLSFCIWISPVINYSTSSHRLPTLSYFRPRLTLCPAHRRTAIPLPGNRLERFDLRSPETRRVAPWLLCAISFHAPATLCRLSQFSGCGAGLRPAGSRCLWLRDSGGVGTSRQFIDEPSSISHLPSSISQLPPPEVSEFLSCILYIQYSESSESFSCILYTEFSESWTAASLARKVGT